MIMLRLRNKWLFWLDQSKIGIDIIKVGKLVSFEVIKYVLSIFGDRCQCQRALLELRIEILRFSRISLETKGLSPKIRSEIQ